MTTQLRFAFAGDRDVSTWVLRYLLGQDARPAALLVSAADRASHADELIELCSFLKEDLILVGDIFRSTEGLEILTRLELDYIIGIHFPYLVPASVLSIPKQGVINLHPAYLPYNRGWHTPSWAILEDTPIGATLHFMDDGIDTGDIIHQKQLEVKPSDTAHTLYQQLKLLEFEVFKEAWPSLTSGNIKRVAQEPQAGTMHKRRDLFVDSLQRIDLQALVKAEALLRRLRALTTNSISESAYFDVDDKRYRVQVIIQEEEAHKE